LIVFVQGTVSAKGIGHVDLDVQGIGYRVHVTERLATSVTVGREIRVFTHYHVREDAHVLFGFESEADRDWFELLITVSGIGPKSALLIVNAMTATAFSQAVAAEDVEALTKLPGIGKKTAQRVIVELKDKVQNLWYVIAGDAVLSEPPLQALTPANSLAADVIEALKMLGYPDKQAFDTVEAVLTGNPQLSTEEALKKCLQSLYQQPVGRR